jgi:hypothetical protein
LVPLLLPLIVEFSIVVVNSPTVHTPKQAGANTPPPSRSLWLSEIVLFLIVTSPDIEQMPAARPRLSLPETTDRSSVTLRSA